MNRGPKHTADSKAPRSQPGSPEVERYLRAVGLPRWDYFDKFQRRVNRDHGSAGELALATIDKRIAGDYSDDLYARKNASAALSLAISGQYDGEFLRRFLTHLVETLPSDLTRVLDVGCENGLITTFIAQSLPNAEVIGIDPSEAALDVATATARKLGVGNVRFERGTAQTLDAGDSRKFDLILGIKSLFDLLAPVDPGAALATREVDFSVALRHLRDPLSKIRSALAASGVFISVERFQSLDLVAWLVGLSESGLRPMLDLSCFLEHTNIDVPDETLPLLVTAPTDPDGPVDRDAFIGFVAYPEFKQFGSDIRLTGFAAESFFEATNPKERILGIEISLTAEWHRIELWRAGSLALWWSIKNDWTRETRIYSVVSAEEGLRRFEEIEQSVPPGAVVRFAPATSDYQAITRAKAIEIVRAADLIP